MPATNIVLNTDEGFLGITNPEVREKALALSLAELVEQIKDTLMRQATALGYAHTLCEVAAECLPADTDSDKSEAMLASMPLQLSEADDALCRMGGCFEALIVRLKEAGQREVPHG